jgi:TonB family protein
VTVWRAPALVLLLCAACPGGRNGNRIENGKGPPIPTDFTPAPPLGAEPDPPDAPGRAWLGEVHRRFHERWADGFLEDARVYLHPTHPLNDPKLTVLLEFAVSLEGELRELAVARPSGNADFDGAAVEVVREAAPFQPPPVELVSDDGFVHVTWTFARDVRQDGLAGAAIDRREWEPARAVPSLLASGRLAEASERIAAALEKNDAVAAHLTLARDVAAWVLSQGLADENDPEARIAAARAAGAVGWTEAAERLRRLAREAPDLRLQKAALAALGALGDASSEKILLEMIDTLDGDRSAAAATSLASLGKADEAWRRVEPRLSDPDARVRAAVLATVADVGAPSSAAPLAELLVDRSASRADRAAAAHALGAVAAREGDPAKGRASKALVAALAEGDATVRAAAARAIARAGRAGLRSKAIYYKLEPLLRDRDPRVRAGAALAAALMIPHLAGPELALIARREKDDATLAFIAEALGVATGSESLAMLIRLSSAERDDVRLAALRALAARAEDDAQKTVAARLSDPDPRARALAAGVLSDAASLATALGDASAEVRAAAVRSLFRAQGTRGLPAALRTLGAASSTRDRVLLAEALLDGTRKR